MKRLFLDIETAPVLAWSWGDSLFEQNLIEIKQDWYVLGIGWKWAHEKQVHWIGQNETSTFAKDKINDFEVIRVAWELLDEADVVIAHNGKQFDIKKLNTRFLLHGLTPPAPYAVLDTKLIARRYFGFTSNKLDELSRQLDKERKLTHTGKKLWFDCMEGDEKAWRLMGKYCKQDVLLLEKKYKSFLPWTEQHPNWNLHGDTKTRCPRCGGFNLIHRGFGYTKTTEFMRFRCKDCGAWSRGHTVNKVGLR